MRLVLDTNVLVSAFFWDGNERRVLEACKDGEHGLAVSAFILDELARVLREKFEVPPEKEAGYASQLVALAWVVDPGTIPDVIEEDPSDNRILACALEAQADAIVSGDSHLLDLEHFKGIQVHRAADLVDP